MKLMVLMHILLLHVALMHVALIHVVPMHIVLVHNVHRRRSVLSVAIFRAECVKIHVRHFQRCELSLQGNRSVIKSAKITF